MSFLELVVDGAIHAVDDGLNPEPDGKDPNEFDATSASDTHNRVTIWVPSERVILNMGSAVLPPQDEKKSKDSGKDAVVDAGFVVETEHRVLFETWGDVAGGTVPARTFLRMGEPSKVTLAGNAYASENQNAKNLLLPESASIGTAYPTPYNAWEGYAMLTEGAAYHEAYQNHIIASASADVRVVGSRAVLVSSPGDVHVMAGAWKNMAAAVGNAVDNSDPSGYGNWTQEVEGWAGFDLALTCVSTMWSQTTLALTIAGEQYFRPALPGRPGWDSFGTAGDWIGFFGGIAAAGVGFALAVKAAANFDPSQSPGSTVTIYGNASVNVYGKTNVTMQSDLALTANASVAATLSGGLSATVSSIVSTTISGISTAVSGYATLSLTSLLGSVSMIGKSSVQVSSSGKVFVASINDDIQIDAMEGSLYLHANDGFFLGCGSGPPTTTGFAGTKYASGPGWGMVGNASGLALGQITDATNYAAPAVGANAFLKFADGSITMGTPAASLIFDSSGVSVSGLGDGRVLLGS